MLSFVLLIGGLFGLWLGTEMVLAGATHIAKHHRIPTFVIGATIVAIGSDLPEIVIAAAGAVQTLGGNDRSDIIVGSSLGSTITQGSLVLGIAGLIAALSLSNRIAIFHGAWLAGSAIALGVLGWTGTISRAEGWILIAMYAIYLGWVVVRARARDEIGDPAAPPARDEEGTVSSRVLMAWVRTIVGITIVVLAADVTVGSAADIANSFGIPDVLIAITVVAVGSSLPELTVAVAGARRGEGSLSVGTLLGSNVLDTLLPIGVAAAIAPVAFDRSFIYLEVTTIVLLATMATFFLGRSGKMTRWQAASLVAVYCIYLALRMTVFA